MSAIRFDTLSHRTALTAKLVAQTAFRVGAGRNLDAVTTDLPVLRAGNGALIVPGSSLKGLMRSCGEQLLRATAPLGREKAWACDVFHDACWELTKEEQNALDDLRPVAKRVEKARELMSERMCRACATFGAQGWAAVARFTDATVKDGSASVRDGVGMDRDLGRAADRIKYDYEVVDPGAWFDLRISLENDQDWQVGLLLAILDQIDDGAVRIGGFGSRGLGWFSVEDKAVVRRDLAAILAGATGLPSDQESFRTALTDALGAGAIEVL